MPLEILTAPMDGRYSLLTVKEACESDDKNPASAFIVAPQMKALLCWLLQQGQSLDTGPPKCSNTRSS